jgi:hypothetical protein
MRCKGELSGIPAWRWWQRRGSGGPEVVLHVRAVVAMRLPPPTTGTCQRMVKLRSNNGPEVVPHVRAAVAARLAWPQRPDTGVPFTPDLHQLHT